MSGSSVQARSDGPEMPNSSRRSNADDVFDLKQACPLSRAFFERSPAVVAPELLGCVVASVAEGVPTGGRIVEVEAYLGAEDPGSHASTKGVTRRNAVMYGAAGVAYVYFTYGNHFMLNAVCEPEGIAGAVLIRALRPLFGIGEMASRRDNRPVRELCNGPGKLCKALGIDERDNAVPFGAGRLSLHEAPSSPHSIAVSGRVGLAQGHDLPLRYYVDGDSFVSRGRTGPPPRRKRSPSRASGSAR